MTTCTTSVVSNFVEQTTGEQQISQRDTLALRSAIARLLEDGGGRMFEGMFTADFAFGTGLNHESDDLIDACASFISKALGGKIDFHKCLRLIANRNSKGEVALLLAAEIAEKKVASIVMKENGTVYLLTEATHKPYLRVLENGNPLVTFASDVVNGGYKPSVPAREMRGVFDAVHYVLSSKMASCLPSKIRLEICAGNYDYKSCYYQSMFGDLYLSDGGRVQKCEFERVGNVLVPKPYVE